MSCRYCGASVTRNALGRASHERSSSCRAPGRVLPAQGAPERLPPRGCFHVFYNPTCADCVAYRSARDAQLKA